MAYISQDPNQNQEANTTNVLAPTSAPTNQPTQTATTSSQDITSSPSTGYISTGNPYGNYATPNQPQSNAGTSASARKSTSGPSSGLQTNVQTYVQKNAQSAEKLGGAVAGKLQNTSDIARQNLKDVQQKFGQGVEAGSVENSGTALSEAQKAFTEAATGAAPTSSLNEKAATLYTPSKTAEGGYNTEDQALVNSNQARAVFGDNTTKNYATQAEAQSAIDDYNKKNPIGNYVYGEEPKLSTTNDRLSEILNAQYKGPQNLSEIGGYNKAYTGYQDVGQLQKQALSNAPKTELLKNAFATPTGEYGKGSQLLDELLLGQGKAAETLQNTAKNLGQAPSGNIADEFTNKINDARTQAAQRTQETDQLRQSARQALNTTATSRTGEVNKRINDVVENWDKYPQYFKDRFKEQLDQHNISSQKKQEYDAAASQYGDYDQINQQIKGISEGFPGINTFDPNSKDFIAKSDAVDAYKNYNRANGMAQAVKMYGESTANKMADEKEKQLYASYQNAITDPVIKSYDEVTKPDNFGNVPTKNEALQQLSNWKDAYNTAVDAKSKLEPLVQYKNYDPNALNVNLSQLEAQALGIQGGEGLYNILKDQGIEGLLKTTTADKNQLVSQQEQSQLARLQSLAELSKDYGVQNSGVNYVNPYANRDLAGKQTALSALDTENLKRQLQGAEQNFRTDAASSNIAGQGAGSGSSSGLLGTKRATSNRTLTQNLGDLIAQNNGYRNMYSDQGVNQDLLKQIIGQAQGNQTFNVGNVDTGVVGGITEPLSNVSDKIQSLLPSINPLGNTATNLAMLGNPLTTTFALGGLLGNTLGGSKASAQNEADRNAQAAALADLQTNIQNKINTTGLKNQLSVGQNQARDLELFKLLGLLDKTNL